MGEAYSMYERDNTFIKKIIGKSERKGLLP
jgi:hypothetical protein